METPQHVRVSSDLYLSNLTPNQILVYASLKMYMNKDTFEAFPSQDVIKKDTGLSKPTIKSCLDKLEKIGEISKRRDGRKYIYKFNPLSKNFEMYSFDFLKDQDLTSEQKAFLVVAQKHMYKDVEGIGKISLSDEELGNKINMSEHTVTRRNLELKNKGILTTVNSKDYEGNDIFIRIYDLTKIYQDFITVAKQVNQNTEDIQELKEENIQLRNELNETKKILNKILEQNTQKETYIYKL